MGASRDGKCDRVVVENCLKILRASRVPLSATQISVAARPLIGESLGCDPVRLNRVLDQLASQGAVIRQRKENFYKNGSPFDLWQVGDAAAADLDAFSDQMPGRNGKKPSAKPAETNRMTREILERLTEIRDLLADATELRQPPPMTLRESATVSNGKR
jgi:hypothetical protein